MNAKTKSLLLGVSLAWADAEIGKVQDSKREEEYIKALERLTIDTDQLESSTISDMLDDPEDVIRWLVGHPKATVELSYWQVEVFSPDFDDVDFERHDPPFEFGGAVEDFTKTKFKDGWVCEWCLG